MKLSDYEDRERIKEYSLRLNNFTNEKLNKQKQFEREIIMDHNEHLDELHIDFINSKNLNFEEMQLVREVFEYLKKR